ncbi:MAG: DeoR/GlpR family DNA-binding transcription regulator [Flavobacteriaceae bacterium]|nr:DeoR/GlpR family DNA-binding transcription regulator [Flavobacteriaceae bacterium]
MSKKYNTKFFQEERQENILNILEKKKRVTTKDLIKKLNTTVVTIRHDLTALENKGLLRRTHGGAIRIEGFSPGLALNEKEKLHFDEKIKIAKKAAEHISEGDTIILDSGSTTSLLAQEIKNKKGITVITNAINIATILLGSDIEIILLGGILLKETSTVVGPLADETLKKLSATKLFFGTDGIDFKVGLTIPNIIEAHTSQIMMRISAEKILLVDSSKFGRRSLGVISKIEEIDEIITTKIMSKKESEIFENYGVLVTVV